MTTSQTANAALRRSLQRARERQTRDGAVSPARSQSRALSNATASSNGERQMLKNLDPSSAKPQWNSSKVYQPAKNPRSVFLEANPPVESVPQQRVVTSTSPMRTPNHTELTTPVRVVRVSSPIVHEPPRMAPMYVQQSYQPYQTSTRLIRTEPEVIVVDSQSPKRSFVDRFQRNENYRTNHYGEREILLNQPESRVYRCCQCCARGRLASACPSCYFCELFYGCPLYCWLLTFLLLLLPLLALFGFFLSEQPALNPAKRQYVTQETSIVENGVYDVMHNCAVPYCTNPSPAVTINVLYQTYRYYSATQITSNGNILPTLSFSVLIVLYILNKLCEISE